MSTTVFQNGRNNFIEIFIGAILCPWAHLPPPTSSWRRNAIGKGWTSESHAEKLLKVVPQVVAPICWEIPPDFGEGGYSFPKRFLFA
jgi:hypothetical protein